MAGIGRLLPDSNLPILAEISYQLYLKIFRHHKSNWHQQTLHSAMCLNSLFYHACPGNFQRDLFGFTELVPSPDDIFWLSLFSGFDVNMQDEMVVI